jgi:hypothetical protein
MLYLLRNETFDFAEFGFDQSIFEAFSKVETYKNQ